MPMLLHTLASLRYFMLMRKLHRIAQIGREKALPLNLELSFSADGLV